VCAGVHDINVKVLLSLEDQFRLAIEHNALDVCEDLLNNPDLKLNDSVVPLLSTAAWYGREEIVQILLNHPRVDISSLGPSARKLALECGFRNVVDAINKKIKTLSI